ncbi:hypothetical protein ACFL3F_01535, partial [Planctomycetota bacterium]
TRTRPLAKSSHILFSRNDCLAAHYEPYISESDLAVKCPDYACMGGITVEDVMGEVKKLLGS